MESAIKHKYKGVVSAVKSMEQKEAFKKRHIITVGEGDDVISKVLGKGSYTKAIYPNVDSFLYDIPNRDGNQFPNVILCYDSLTDKDIRQLVSQLRNSATFGSLPILLLTNRSTIKIRTDIFNLGLDDVLDSSAEEDLFYERIELIRQAKKKKLENNSILRKQNIANIDVNISFSKRAGDILVSLILLVMLAPAILILVVLIKIESKGPVLYTSKRAGAGYKIFNFYKFRSMSEDAEKEMTKVLHLNQYDIGKDDLKSIFYKIKGDPRVTKIGAFMRKTSIDELPQLINVLKGDMSLVGNRPLPLYEAQQLTRDSWVARFNAPAGITGLWQISKRGKAAMSEEDRVNLDIEYSRNWSFWYDLKILIRTLPVIFQEEDV